MSTTTIESLDSAITGAGSDWPLLSYDSQVTLGTMLLLDFANPAQWPTGDVGGPFASSDEFFNLGERAANGVLGTGDLPSITGDGILQAASTAASIVFPAGLFDLAALGWPDFHMTVWGTLPATPLVANSQRIIGFGNTSAAMQWGITASSSSGTTIGINPRLSNSGTAQILQPGGKFQAAITLLDLGQGNGSKRLRTYVNGNPAQDGTITPAVAAAPTNKLSIGKGETGFTHCIGARISRVIVENCTLAGRDPDLARSSEWTAQRALRGL